MKKIITLMGIVLLAASSFAQHNPGNQRNQDDDVVYNDDGLKDHHDRRYDRYHYNNRERDMQIANINQEYDRKTEEVKHRWFMSHSEKKELIYSLENKRRYEIRKLYAKSNNRYDHNNHNECSDRDDDS
jgi:hypothetical protein